MTDEELERMLDDLESDHIERTESTDDGDKFRQAVCAFANDLPGQRNCGVLFVGVNNRGEPTGIDVSDRLLQNLASIRGDGNILPFPSLDVQKRRLKGVDVAVVLVHPSDSPPVRFKGTVWIRSGPRRGIANPEDERRLNEKRRYRDVPWDIQPLSSAPLDVLDESVFQKLYLPAAVSVEVLEQNQRTLEHKMLALKMTHPGPPVSPTVLGVLTIGKAPTEWIPGAYVQFVRVDGTEIGDPVSDAREIRGTIMEILSQLDELLKVNISTSVDFTTSAQEIQHPDYPIAAVQQIVRNAILHRSYENTNSPVRIQWFRDRIEVLNPGGPFGQVTKQNFGRPGASDYRNANLAAVMKELGYVQRFGAGIATARREMQKNGNPDLEFQVEDAFVMSILRRRQ